MKNIFRIGSTVVLTFLVTVVGATFFVSAQDDNASMRSVIERLDRLTEVLVNALDNNSGSSNMESSGEIETMAGGIPNQMVNPRCLDGYSSWPKSNHYKEDADWNISYIPTDQYSAIGKDGLFMDINSDGLTDYVFYKYTNVYGLSGTLSSEYDGAVSLVAYQSCILLNTGHGWEIANRCVVNWDDGRPTFYGDCADLSL